MSGARPILQNLFHVGSGVGPGASYRVTPPLLATIKCRPIVYIGSLCSGNASTFHNFPLSRVNTFDMLRVAIVGLGRRSQHHAIPYFLHDHTRWQLEAVCDTSSLAIDKFIDTFPSLSSVPTFTDVSLMISSKSLDCVYVAVPHDQSSIIVSHFLSSKIHVMKEKPAAMNAKELELFQELARSNAVTFSTASQMRYSEQAQQMQQWLPLIGKVRFAEGIMTIPVRDLGAGWRASRVLSGGGVLIDLGWHVVDLVLKLLGDLTIQGVEFAQLLQTRPSQEYDCEDTARAILKINNRKLATEKGTISCSIFVSRLGPTKKTQLTIYGEYGSLRLENDCVEIHLTDETESRVFGKALKSELHTDRAHE